MDVLKKLLLMIVGLAVVVGVFVFIFTVDHVLPAIGALFFAGGLSYFCVVLVGFFIDSFEVAIGGESAKTAGMIIKIILFIVGMIIFTPWLYNVLESSL